MGRQDSMYDGNRLYGQDRPTVHNARRYVRVLILLQRCRSVQDGRITVVVGVNQMEGSRQLLCPAHSLSERGCPQGKKTTFSLVAQRVL